MAVVGLAQNGFDELQFGGGKAISGRAYFGGFPAPLRGFGETVLQGRTRIMDSSRRSRACRSSRRRTRSKPFELEAELHHSSMVSSAETVRSIGGISKVA